MEFKTFYEAWWFLFYHPMYQDKHEDSRFLQCTDIHVTKVNPENDTIEDDETLNTKTQVWLESGYYEENNSWHDIELDCGADNYEEAIIKLAELVYKNYGGYKKEEWM